MPLDAHATEEEDKLILLSSLSRLGGCTQEQLLRFLAESGLMNPFQFYLALGGLKEAGFIREDGKSRILKKEVDPVKGTLIFSVDWEAENADTEA